MPTHLHILVVLKRKGKLQSQFCIIDIYKMIDKGYNKLIGWGPLQESREPVVEKRDLEGK